MEDLHHVFFGIADLVVGGPLAVGRDVVRAVVVQHFEDVLRGGRGDDGGCDDLEHRLVVAGVRGVVHEAGAGSVDV